MTQYIEHIDVNTVINSGVSSQQSIDNSLILDSSRMIVLNVQYVLQKWNMACQALRVIEDVCMPKGVYIVNGTHDTI